MILLNTNGSTLTFRMLHLAIAHKNINLTLAIILAMVTRREENSNGINMQNKLRQVKIILLALSIILTVFLKVS